MDSLNSGILTLDILYMYLRHRGCRLFWGLNPVFWQSVSDDSMDLGSCDKQPDAQSGCKSAQRPARPLWEDDDDDGESGRRDGEESILHE